MFYRRLFPRAIASAAAAVLLLTGGALADTSADGTINVTVAEPTVVCTPPAPLAVTLTNSDTITVSNGSATSDATAQFWVNVQNADCTPWHVSASLTDFALAGGGTTFPASALSLNKWTGPGAPNVNPTRWVTGWDPLPPSDNVGTPTMPDTVTFTEGSGSATSDQNLMDANTASNGSPGFSTAYFRMSLSGLDTTLPAGDYSSTITVSVTGGD